MDFLVAVGVLAIVILGLIGLGLWTYRGLGDDED